MDQDEERKYMLQDFSHNLDVALCLRSEQFNPLLRCCSLKNPTSYKSCIFHIPKANHLKARSVVSPLGVGKIKQRYISIPYLTQETLCRNCPYKAWGMCQVCATYKKPTWDHIISMTTACTY